MEFESVVSSDHFLVLVIHVIESSSIFFPYKLLTASLFILEISWLESEWICFFFLCNCFICLIILWNRLLFFFLKKILPVHAIEMAVPVLIVFSHLHEGFF